MTDRELLELAAKAAGLDIRLTWTPGTTPWVRNETGTASPWNPLDDDGDALRLAVRLNMNVLVCPDAGPAAEAWTVESGLTKLCEEDISGDPYAATRRAIVRAAAEIGRHSNG